MSHGGKWREPAAQTMKDFTNSGISITDSPHYSAHKTNTKFFKTIEENPILGASASFHRGGTPVGGRESRNK